MNSTIIINVKDNTTFVHEIPPSSIIYALISYHFEDKTTFVGLDSFNYSYNLLSTQNKDIRVSLNIHLIKH